MTGVLPSFRARWTWLAGSTNDCPFETLNGAQLATEGSRTVKVPPVTTTATGELCVCQPKLPPCLIVITSRIIAPAVAWIVVGFIVPTARALAKTGASLPSDGAAVARTQTKATPSSLMLIISSPLQVLVVVSGSRLGGTSSQSLCVALAT